MQGQDDLGIQDISLVDEVPSVQNMIGSLSQGAPAPSGGGGAPAPMQSMRLGTSVPARKEETKEKKFK